MHRFAMNIQTSLDTLVKQVQGVEDSFCLHRLGCGNDQADRLWQEGAAGNERK